MMKLVQIHVHDAYGLAIEALLESHGVRDLARHRRVPGRDRQAPRHDTRIFPGSLSVVQALVAASSVDSLMRDLQQFRQQHPAHEHLQAMVIDVQQVLVPRDGHHRT